MLGGCGPPLRRAPHDDDDDDGFAAATRSSAAAAGEARPLPRTRPLTRPGGAGPHNGGGGRAWGPRRYRGTPGVWNECVVCGHNGEKEGLSRRMLARL